MDKCSQLKILHIITRLCVSGTSSYVIQIAQAMKNEKYQSYVLAGKIEPDESDMAYLAAQYGIKPYYIRTMRRNLNPVNDFVTILSIMRIIAKLKPDIIFTHNAKAGVVGRVAAYIMRVPVIIHTFHGNNFSGYFGKFMSRFSILTERILASGSTCLIAISPQQYEDLLTYKISAKQKIKMIPLGFDLAQIIHRQSDVGEFRRKYHIPPDKKIIALVGWLALVKSPDMFLSISRQILDIRDDVIFCLIGDGELRKDLEENIKFNSLENRIKVIGFVQDLRSLYADMDILLLTSVREGTPVSIIEAMANGKIVIANRVGGIVDLIDHERNGYIYALEQENSMIEKINSILNNPNDYNDIRESARKKICEQYSLPVLVNNMEQLLSECVKHNVKFARKNG
jgi:glycosyltransferase involved in cell wall biosynthesis